ncbi:MAG: glycoside hydrolase family 88 protein [Bacteroidales bacterium]|nr:glycoside hydrolase family 88 protein [Bacteroidales bacterium]MCF8389927.1 glycoside hydrolase family 88 protein [Bacteroidales bacterium]
MKTKTFYIFLTIAFCFSNLYSQLPVSDVDLVAKLADKILNETSFKIVNTSNGKLYSSSGHLPLSPDFRLESAYNDWSYWNGVLAIAMLDLSETTGNPKYSNYVEKNYDFIFNNLDYFRQQYEEGYKRTSLRQFYRLALLDDCGAMGAGLLDLYQLEPEEEYLEYLERAADFIKNRELRLEDGTFVRKSPRPMTLWADDLYMSVPFLVRMAKLTGETEYYDDAILQVKNFTHYLYNENNQIYYHCWYEDNGQNGVAHWGRCNGWVMMAQVELLKNLPANHPSTEELIRILQNQITGISRYQDPSGLWHQIIDKNDSYLETSATAMFIYSIAKSVNEGWIPASYEKIALRAWEGLKTMITDQAEVDNICIGTGISDDLLFYYERPVKRDDIHGLGAVLLAGIEINKLLENNKVRKND